MERMRKSDKGEKVVKEEDEKVGKKDRENNRKNTKREIRVIEL